jgi:hypothetical protein
VFAGHTVVAMTEIDGPATRRRFTWSARAQGNRITYALVIGWLVWLLARRPSEWLVLPVAAVAWTAMTVVLVMIDRRRWENS